MSAMSTDAATAPSPDAPEPATDTEQVTVDVVVIGGGPVGENIAQYATEGTELTAAIVEGELMGGECSYYACIPSKALLRPLALAEASAHMEGVAPGSLRAAELLRRRDDWVHQYDDSSQADWAEGAGIRVLRGHGRLSGEREVTVEGEHPVRVTARHAVVLATGSTPTVPPALQGLGAWTSRDATGVREVPERLAIVGGGVVATEAATWMAALGSTVTLLVRGDRLLPGTEPAAGQFVLDALRERGVTVHLGTEVTAATRDDVQDTGLGRRHGGPLALDLSGDGPAHLEVDELLVATGRRPRLDDLALETVGLTPAQVLGGDLPGWLLTVGDASGEAPLTHWGKYRARVLGDRVRAEATGQIPEPEPSVVPVPQVVFTEPQVAAVGMTAAQAEEAGHRVATAEVGYGSTAGTALIRDDADGTAILVVDADTGIPLGATLVGPEAAELIHPATVAIVGQVPVSVLRHAVPSFPTASELWLRLLEELPRELRHRL